MGEAVLGAFLAVVVAGTVFVGFPLAICWGLDALERLDDRKRGRR